MSTCSKVGINAALRPCVYWITFIWVLYMATVLGQRTTTVVPSTTTLTPTKTDIALQACCNTNCVTYSNPLELFGLQCCGNDPVNLFTQICCNGVSHNRRQGTQYYEDCCGTQPLAWDQTCCMGQVHNVVGQVCCGSQPYNAYDTTKLCCKDALHPITAGSTLACCGNSTYDGGSTQFCCGDIVYSKQQKNRCCVQRTTDPQTGTVTVTGAGYDSNTEFCCDKVYSKTTGLARGYDTCCYVYESTANTWTPTPFNSTVQCCAYVGVRTIMQNGTCPVV